MQLRQPCCLQAPTQAMRCARVPPPPRPAEPPPWRPQAQDWTLSSPAATPTEPPAPPRAPAPLPAPLRRRPCARAPWLGATWAPPAPTPLPRCCCWRHLSLHCAAASGQHQCWNALVLLPRLPLLLEQPPRWLWSARWPPAPARRRRQQAAWVPRLARRCSLARRCRCPAQNR